MRTRRPFAPSLHLLLCGALLASAACRGSSSAKVATPAAAAEAAGAAALSDEPLPLSPEVVRGELPSGLTYYVRPNAKPVKRATLWLVVDAGSVLEEDDQRGLAHFLEHMAFNGTRRFAKQEIVDYLERIGMRFGPDVNAFTSFDETVYQLEVPTDDPEALGRAVDILHEWAQGVAIEQEEVDKERGVVLEERRLGRGAQGRLLDQVLPAALPGSRYGQRMVIGTEEVLQTAGAEAMRRFYQDWYRPDLMAVVAVGDFDPAAMEAMIRERFGDLEKPAAPRPRPEVEVPPHDHTVAITVSDPELPITVVGIAGKRPRRVLTSARDYRLSVLDQLFTAMLNQRLDELSRSPEAPFVGAAVGRQTIVRPLDVWFQFAVVKGAGVTGALEALTAEVERVARFGFTATEIERAKKELMRHYQQAAREADTTPSAQHADETQRHFLRGEAMPGIAAELALVERILPGVTAAELQAVAREVAAEDSRVIIAAGNSGTRLPDKAALLAAAAAGRAKAAEAYVDEAATGPLLPREPTPGRITGERTITELGVTEWTLQNGMTVVLKPTTFKNDQVAASLRAPGGHSLASDADQLSARVAAEIAAASGYGAHSAVQLSRRLAGTGVSHAFQVGELESVLAGGAPPDQLELLLQLFHLAATAPRVDPKAFAAWKAQQVELLRNQMADPEIAFSHGVAAALAGDHPRRRPLLAEDYEKIDLDRAVAFHRERFASAAGTTFVLVGAFEPEKVKPLVLKYLGGLPGSGQAARWRDIGVKHPTGTVRVELVRGLEPKARVHLEYHGPARHSREAEHEIASLAHALGIRLREELREGMGGVYGVGVHGQLQRDPTGRYSLSIQFGCAPENVDALVERARAEIAAFVRRGPPAPVVAKVAAAQLRERQTALESNGFWLNALGEHYRDRTDPRAILQHGRLVDRLTPQLLRGTARRVFGKNQVVGILRPQ